jgi:predicted nucleic acid-binding protein
MKDGPIELLSLERIYIEHAVHVMEAYDLTFYDAVYAAIAMESGATLLSANIKDHGKIKEINVLQVV